MFFQYANVFIFIILGLLMTLAIITVSRVLAPRVKDIPDKFTTYECGERPVGSAWILFNFRFYAVALAFLIFDIELIYMWNRGDLKWTKEVPAELEEGVILEEEKPIMF